MARRYCCEVRHEGLGKRRVITDSNKNVLRWKAEAQMAEWNRMWEERQAAARQRAQRARYLAREREAREQERLSRTQQADEKRRAREEAAELAAERTKEAQQALADMESILGHTLTIDDAIDWDSLKDHSTFAVARPQEPTIPREPQKIDSAYRPQLGLLGHLSSSSRGKREAEAAERFSKAHVQWEQQRDALMAAYREAVSRWEQERDAFMAGQKERNQLVDDRRQKYLAKDPAVVIDYSDMVLANSEYPECLPASFEVDYSPDTRTLIVDYQLPTPSALPTVKEVKFVQSRNELRETLLSERELNSLYDRVVYQVALRTVHELFEADRADALAAVAFNGWVTSADAGTGQERTACILSLHTTKEQFLSISLARVEPKQCFKALKGVGSPQLHSLTAVAPIMEISREDRRFIQSYEVADWLEEGYNLAVMDWEDFEHLVRELFEKELAQSGGEVKVTQASRDGGVDAVAFDPDPIRGGKIVIQAKRYTQTVGVSAVRDLYGTVVNEGATKGILVTTSDFGPDAHEFAKGKPIVLLSGANLLHLLAKHGYKATIDLVAARRLEKSGD